ncbi:hypothetical protein [Streptomyces cellulosae]|uniref:hypothetical protein n=1 Tax=Streptomyces cellulosae TaxID=1968 RepID=UPI00131CF8C7|nr:hypothetical protein [Streptomyces cellulosae]
MANAFDAAGRMMLPHASPEGWAATVATDLARGDKTLETAVKVGKYILHPTPLALADDATRIVGEALHDLNVRRLQELAHSLRCYASATGPSHPVAGTVPAIDVPVRAKPHNMSAEHDRPSVRGPKQPERPDSKPRVSVGTARQPVTTPEGPDSKPRIRLGVPCSPSTRRPGNSGPVSANPATPERPDWKPRVSVGTARQSVTTPEGPDSKPRIRLGVPCSPSTRRPGNSGPVPANPATPASAEPACHPRSSNPQSSGIPGPHNLW